MSFDWRDFQGVNSAYVLELYEKFQRDPQSVDSAARAFFRQWTPPAEPQPIADTPHREAVRARGAGVAPAEAHPGTPAPTAGTRGTPEPQNLSIVVGAINLAQSIRRYGHLAAQIDPLGSRPIGDPALLPATHGVTDADLAALPATLISSPIAQGAQTMAEVVERLRRLYCSTTGYDFAHIFVPEERRWLREAVETESLSRAGQSDRSGGAARSADAGRSVREVHPPVLSREDPLLDRGPRHARPDPGRGHHRGGGSGDAPGVHRHGASRPAERDGARAGQAVRADPRRVQGSGAELARDRGRAVERRRQVPPRRVAHGRRRRKRSRWSSRCRPIRATSRRSMPCSKGMARAAGHRGESSRPARVQSRCRAADPDSRRRRVLRPGRRGRDAEPAPAGRVHDGRHDSHHRQQPDRVHDGAARCLQHALRERAGARVQDSDRARQRRRSGGVCGGRAAGVRVSRAVQARFPHRPHRLPAATATTKATSRRSRSR